MVLIPTFLFDWCSVIDWYERARKWNKVGAVLYANSFLYEMGFFSVASTVIAVHDVLTEHKQKRTVTNCCNRKQSTADGLPPTCFSFRQITVCNNLIILKFARMLLAVYQPIVQVCALCLVL